MTPTLTHAEWCDHMRPKVYLNGRRFDNLLATPGQSYVEDWSTAERIPIESGDDLSFHITIDPRYTYDMNRSPIGGMRAEYLAIGADKWTWDDVKASYPKNPPAPL